MNHLERLRTAADTLNGHLTDILDLAGVPDGSHTEIKATKAMGQIYDVIDQIPRQGRTASLVFEDGPLIYVDPHKDIRDWKTSSGIKASQTSQRAAALAKSKKTRLAAQGPILSRRVITARLYEDLFSEDSLSLAVETV
jgi:hypothetical protein